MSYSENLFRSIDEILKQRLNEIQFDKTVLCTIVNQDENDKTKYWVTDGSLRFEAFSDSDNERYANKSQVYVLVPEGNYEKRKIILGRYTDDKEDKVYQQATENIQLKAFSDFVSAYTIPDPIDPNDAEHKQTIPIHQYLNNEASYSSDLDLSFHGLGGFTQLGIKFSIDSFSVFQNKKISEYSGSYGLYFDFKNANNEILYKTVLDSSQIYGNPYMLTHNQIFEFVLPFNDNINPYDIKKLTIDFYYKDNNELAEISISNFKLYLGYSSEDIRIKLNELSNTNGLIAFLPSGSELKYPLKYDKQAQTYISENIYVNWITEDDGKYKIYNKYQGFSENSSYTMFWGKYENGYQSEENFERALGVYYKDITNRREENKEGNIIITIEDQWLKTFNNNIFEVKQPTTSFKVAILEKNENASYTSLASYPFYFTNTSIEIEAGASNGIGDSLILQLGAGDDGRYNIYGNDNKIIANLGGNKNITAKFVQDDLNNSGSALKLSNVVWKIPKVGTQLAPIRVYDKNLGSYKLADNWYEDNKYYIYTPKIIVDRGSEQLQELNLTYSFNSIYNPGNTNNKIICEVTGSINTTSENGENVLITQNFIGTMDVYFGMAGTSGTDFNFYITADSDRALVSEIDTLTLTAHLETLDGINKDSEIKEITWDIGKFFEESKDDTQHQITISRNYTNDDNIPNTNPWDYVTASVVLETDIRREKIELQAYYLPTQGTNSVKLISGPLNVIYDEFGLHPTYDSSPYKFIDVKENKPIEPNSFKFYYSKANKEIDLKETNKGKFPEGEYSYLPEFPSFISTEVDRCYLEAIFISNNSTWYWQQPIYMARNSYASKILNTWDGSTVINNEQNYILSQMVGAGTKDKSNKFTGVLMGQVGKAFNAAKHGLYGFEAGEERFSFTEKGGAFIGTGSDNFISFNEGNTRTSSGELNIKVKKFFLGNNTTKITGDSNGNIEIVAKRFTLGNDQSDNNKSYIITGDNNGNLTFSVTGGTFLVQNKSLNSPNDDQTYLKMSSDGTLAIKANSFHLNASTTDSKFLISSVGYNANETNGHFQIGNNSNHIKWYYNDEKKGYTFDIAATQFYLTTDRLIIDNYGIRYYDKDIKYNDKTPIFQIQTNGYYKFIVNTDNFKLNEYGSVWFNGTGTFEGDIYANNGTFGGTLNAAGGTFSGTISSGAYLGTNSGKWGILISQASDKWVSGELYDQGIQLRSKKLGTGDNALYTALVLRNASIELNRYKEGSTNPITNVGIEIPYIQSGQKLRGIWQCDTWRGSDYRIKKDFNILSENYNKFFDLLNPLSYRFIDNTSNRIHIGFIAQDIKLALENSEMTSSDFAGLIITDPNNEEEAQWGLRYDEFIALNTWQIQMLKSRVAELEKEIKEIKQNEI